MENEQQQVIELSAEQALQRHEDRLNTLVDAVSDLAEQLTKLVSRVLDGEKRLAVLEGDQRDVEKGMRDSLDEIQKGMAGMLRFMREHQKPVQNPAKALLN